MDKLPEDEADSWCFLKLQHEQNCILKKLSMVQCQEDAYFPSGQFSLPVFNFSCKVKKLRAGCSIRGCAWKCKSSASAIICMVNAVR